MVVNSSFNLDSHKVKLLKKIKYDNCSAKGKILFFYCIKTNYESFLV